MPQRGRLSQWNRIRPVLWRGALIVLIVVAAEMAFSMGVDVTDRPGIGDTGPLTKLYYIAGLFVLGGLDLGVPTGGSFLGRCLLWFAYFGAPTITGIAVIEGVFRTVSPDQFRLRRIRNHHIVAGEGGLVETYLSRLAELNVSRTVVLVLEEDAHMPSIPRELRSVVVRGEIRSEAILESLRLEHARRVFLAQEDGFANLDAAASLIAREPRLAAKTIVHVGDLALLHSVRETRVGRECQIFNSHQIAATHLVRSELLEWFAHTQEDDIVILGGFGRFGQTVLSELQNLAKERFNQVIVIDPEADLNTEHFQVHVGFERDAYDLHVVNDDLSCPRVWRQLEERFALSRREPAFVFGCGEDSINIRASLHVATTYPESRVLARVMARSAFAEDLAQEKDVHIISVSELVKESMPKSWFGRDRSRFLAGT